MTCLEHRKHIQSKQTQPVHTFKKLSEIGRISRNLLCTTEGMHTPRGLKTCIVL